MSTGWGFGLQQPAGWQEVDELGRQLSIEIGCAIHYPAYGKRLYECRCGVVFPVYLVASRDWDKLRTKHREERKLVPV